MFHIIVVDCKTVFREMSKIHKTAIAQFLSFLLVSRLISLTIYNGNHDALSHGNLDIIICKLKQKISRLS